MNCFVPQWALPPLGLSLPLNLHLSADRNLAPFTDKPSYLVFCHIEPIAIDITEFFFGRLRNTDQGERCVCEIVPYLKEEQSNVSRHLAALKRAGILSSRKEGVSVYYRVEDENVYKIPGLALDSVKKAARERIAIFN